MQHNPMNSFDRMFDQLRRDMFELRGSLSENRPALERSSSESAIDLTEADGEYVLTIDMPGFDRDEIELRYTDGQLSLSAEHEAEDDVTSQYRSMQEQVRIPGTVDADAISASYHNGVLEVHLPILGAAEEAGHRIDIE